MEIETFSRRRARFYDAIGDGVAVLFAAPEARFGHDTEYRYRPDPDFVHVTGFGEPKAVAVFDGRRRRFVLFVRPKDRERETWEGRRAGIAGARAAYGADEAHPIAALEEKLPALLRPASSLWHAWGISAEADAMIAGLLARFRREARHVQRGPVVVHDPTDVLHALRLVKDAGEIALLERSAAIACRAHREAMAAARPGRFEYEVEAVLLRRFAASGASGPSYHPIVASGENATVLHYVENRRRISAGDLVLVDAGCEYEGYASDVTRTFPASGRFTRAQRRLYAVVLAAQEAAIAAVAPGARFDAVHRAAQETLVDGLVDLGLLRGRRETLMKRGAQERFTLHRTSHWLGRDVHDRGRYSDEKGEPRRLEEGMVLTVEPGLYVRPDEKKVRPEWLGLGVRIEDDVLVTASGRRVLTEAAPKAPDEIQGRVAATAATKKSG